MKYPIHMIFNDFSICPIFRQGSALPCGQSDWRFFSALIHKVIPNSWGQAKNLLVGEQVSALFKKIPQQPALTIP
jgi:hypothetical protein